MSEKIEVGGIYEGKVVKIKPFGAIVSLPGNILGLVHISHISSSYVQNVADHLAPGDECRVKVLSMEAGKISLSIKEACEQHAVVDRDDHRDVRPKGDHGSFEDKFKEWVKISNERQAGLNKRNKRR